MIVRNSSIILNNYEIGDNPKLEKYLSTWNPNFYRYDYNGLRYNHNKKELRIPRSIPLELLNDRIKNSMADIKIPEIVSDICLTVPPRDKIQDSAINFLMKEHDIISQKKLIVDTGLGKTYVTIASVCGIHGNAMIITNNTTIKEQWKSALLKFTDVSIDRILNVSSSKHLLNVSENQYDFILVTHKSLQSYYSQHGFDKFEEMFDRINPTVKVFDEAHLNFDNMITIDLFSNVPITIYLTATFGRSDFGQDKIFQRCYSTTPTFSKVISDLDLRHIIYTPVLFNSAPSSFDKIEVIGNRGFDKLFYIKYQLNKDIFYNVIDYVINYFVIKNSLKTVLLLSTIESVDIIYDFIKTKYENINVIRKHSKIKKPTIDDTESADIICSTPKSIGTGDDIDKLQVVIMTEPYSSKITAKQISGRLRKQKNGIPYFYIELVDTGFPKVFSLYKNRLPLFKKRAKMIKEIKYQEMN